MITIEILKNTETTTTKFNDYENAIEFLKKQKQNETNDAFLKVIQNNVSLKNYLAENTDYILCLGEQRYSSYKGMTEEYSSGFCETDFYNDLEKAGVKLNDEENEIITEFGFSCMFEDSEESCPVIYTFYAEFNEDFTTYKIQVDERDNY